MGTTEEVFQQVGKCPSLMEMLKSLAMDGAMLVAVYLSILMEIPSGPLALVASKAWMYDRISSVVHRRSSELADSNSVWVCLSSSSCDRGGTDVLKQDEKYSLSMAAFS